MEVFLNELLPSVLGNSVSFQLHVHQGKYDLLSKLQTRLRGYSHWLPENHRIVVVVDRDDDDCIALKQTMENAAHAANLVTPSSGGGTPWRVANRIAVEELEAWFFGDWQAVRLAYPRVSASVPRQAAYRNPDTIAGGTWEALERVLKRAGYFANGLRKMEAAQSIGRQFDPARTTSPSFSTFHEVLIQAIL